MRTDALCLLFAGAGGFAGSGFFPRSPLCEVRDEFSRRYPAVSLLCFSWDEPANLFEIVRGKKLLMRGHSFGAQRALHQLYTVGGFAESCDLQLDDAVRYSASDTTDPIDEIRSNPFVQKFDRLPLPVCGWAYSCVNFLRKGGQGIFSYPQSSPISPETDQFRNVIVEVPGMSDFQKHADICRQPEVDQHWWELCERVLGVRMVLSL